MAITKLSNSGIATGGVLKYDSMLAGNSPYLPSDYESIATITVSGASSFSMEFTSIPSTYTHLQIRGVLRGTVGAYAGIQNLGLRFNSDSGTNYAYHALFGNGDNVPVIGATNDVNISQMIAQWGFLGDGGLANTYGAYLIDILDYANTNKAKTVRTLMGVTQNATVGAANSGVGLNSGVWRNNNAITSIYIQSFSGGDIKQYSKLALYGIKGV